MTRITLIDDHHLFSSLLALALRGQGLEVEVPTVTTVPELRQRLGAARPDVLLLDRDLGAAGNGEDLIAPASADGMAVVVVAATLDEVVMGRCLAAGAVTCIPKTAPFADVLATVMAVARGDGPCPPAERKRLVDAWRRSEACATAIASPFGQLTRCEAEVLAELIAGHRVKEIAARQLVASATVRTHVRSIFEKLGVTSQLEAVALAAQAGWHPATARAARASSQGL